MTRTLLAALAAALILAAPASADRYAALNGSGSACTEAQPCTLPAAITAAAGVEPVLVRPGNYGPYETSLGTVDVLRGTDPTQPPRIESSGPFLRVDTRLQDVQFVNSGGGEAIRAFSATIERVSSVTLGSGPAIQIGADSALLDSAFVSTSGKAVYFSGAGGSMRNVTAVGGTNGLYAFLSSGGVSITVKNSILQGGEYDVYTSGSITTSISYSNYDSQVGGGITPGAGNQSQPAQLVEPFAGDVGQLATSPTVDAADATGFSAGALSLFGLPRVMRNGPDIGATELPPEPIAVTGPATVNGSSATLEGAGNGQGVPGAAHFEYGPTTDYGSTTADAPVTAGETPLSATIDSLALGTTYHYRLVATTSGGTVRGADATFTTPAPPADVTAPRLSDVALTRTRFRAGSAITALIAAKPGTTLLYTLSEAATVKVVVQRAARGRRKGARCVVDRRTGKRCTRWKTQGTLTRTGVPGANRMSFSGRFGTAGLSKRLKPGKHRFVLTARDGAGNVSRPTRIGFRVVRR